MKIQVLLEQLILLFQKCRDLECKNRRLRFLNLSLRFKILLCYTGSEMFPQLVLIIATYDENGKANAMNAAWGGIVGMDKIIC